MAPARVLIIGAGVAGPPLATLLKMKGYDPVVFERIEGPPTSGLALGVAPNGQAVLEKIPGLVEEIRAAGSPVEMFSYMSVVPEDHGMLCDVPLRAPQSNAPRAILVRREALLKALAACAEKTGVSLRWDHNMESLEQTDNGVKVRFTNGVEEEGSFVVGCDGLHSNVRKALFGDEKADFTGLACCGGFAPVPEGLKDQKSKFINIFGNNAHMLAANTGDDTMFWMCTTRELEAKETWKAMDDAKAEDFKKNSIFANWDFHGGELVKTGYNLTRFGLYDRPELKSWHQGRVVLVGDATHPTSPHLGQGANQSFEDIDRLIQLLEKHNPSAESPSTALLETIFTELETERIPKTTEVVRGARAMGDTRVVEGVQACIERNNLYREMAKDPNGVRRKLMMPKAAPPPVSQ